MSLTDNVESKIKILYEPNILIDDFYSIVYLLKSNNIIKYDKEPNNIKFDKVSIDIDNKKQDKIYIYLYKETLIFDALQINIKPREVINKLISYLYNYSNSIYMSQIKHKGNIKLIINNFEYLTKQKQQILTSYIDEINIGHFLKQHNKKIIPNVFDMSVIFIISSITNFVFTHYDIIINKEFKSIQYNREKELNINFITNETRNMVRENILKIQNIFETNNVNNYSKIRDILYNVKDVLWNINSILCEYADYLINLLITKNIDNKYTDLKFEFYKLIMIDENEIIDIHNIEVILLKLYNKYLDYENRRIE